MRVFIDVTSACRSPQNTGMQRMTRKIFAELNVRFDVRPISWNKVGNIYTELGEQEFRFLTRPFESRSHGAARPEWRGEDPLTELYRMLRRRRVNLEKEIGADNVFLVPDIFRDRRREALPVFLKQTGARTIAIFHDATDLRLTDVYPEREKKTRPYLEALALFDLVICVSKEARDDLRHFWKEYSCDAADTCVEPWPGELEGAEASPDSNTSGNFILYVSSFHGRKNHLKLFRAAEKLWKEGLIFELQLIGRNVGAPLNKIVREIWRLRLAGRPVRWLRHVDDVTLLRGYRECRFTVYPSLMEGYGLPIVESLLHGKPCICGGNGALGEVARGGGCLIVDQTNTAALAEGIKTLLLDRQLYARLSAEARARKFRSWSEYIDKFLMHLKPASDTNAAHASMSH
jgi:glycosyltransferase involved in cell wall biosynthesis